MYRRIKQVLIGCLITTSGLGLSACGSGGNESATASEPGSLDEFFNTGDAAAQRALFDKQQRKAEEKIAACMRAEGFEYTPVVGQQTNFSNFPQPKRGEEVAFLRKNGYNVAAGMSQNFAAPPAAAENPNEKRLAKMTEGERNAYQKALFGYDATKPQADPQVQPKGCANNLFAEQNDLWKPLEPKLEAIRRQTEADPDLVRLNAGFVSCMNKAGYNISAENEIYMKLLSERQNKVYAESFSSSTETSVAGAQPSVQTIPPAKIAEFKKYELQVANADADCRPQKDVDEIRAIRAKYEKAFIDENKVALEKVKAAQG
jgi:hypothetical protein